MHYFGCPIEPETGDMDIQIGIDSLLINLGQVALFSNLVPDSYMKMRLPGILILEWKNSFATNVI